MSRNDELHQEAIQQALTLAVRDQDGKYDECLVERLLLCIESGSKDLANIALQVITELNNDCQFKDSNNSRLFRLQKAYCHNELSVFEEDLEVFWLRCVWSKMSAVLTRNDPSEIKSLLPLLIAIVECRSSLKILEMYFVESPIESGHVIDILTLLKCFLTDNKNYHIQNAACDLLCAMITQSIATDIKSRDNSPVLKLVKELILAGCPAMYYVILNITQDQKIELLREIAQEPLKARLDAAIKDRKEIEVNNICKCLGRLLDGDREAEYAESIINKLKNAYLFGPLLTFATHSLRPSAGYRPLFHLILYTILTRTWTEWPYESISHHLDVSSEDRDFVEKNCKDRHVLQCLEYLEKSFHHQEEVALHDESNTKNDEQLAFSVVLQYIRSNYNRSDNVFKNLLTSCMLLPKLLSHYDKDLPKAPGWQERFNWLPNQVCPIFSELIEPFHDNTSSSQKALILELICDLEFFLELIEVSEALESDRLFDLECRIMKFASKVTDPDVLVEVLHLINSVINIVDTHSNVYLSLTYSHIRKIALEQNHHPLLREVIVSLHRIESNCQEDDLIRAGIIRFQTIPNFYNDILNDPTMGDESIETIAWLLCFDDVYFLSPEDDGQGDKYISLICKHSTSSCIERMTEGICKSLRRDIAQKNRVDLLDSLETILKSSRFDQIGSNGVKDVLKTLYCIHTDDENVQEVRSRACEIFRSAKCYILILDRNSEIDKAVFDFFREHHTKECRARNEQSEPYLQNCLGIESYVDQIINQEGAVHLECY